MAQTTVSERIASRGDFIEFAYASATDSSALGDGARRMLEHQVEDFAGARVVSVRKIESERAGVRIRVFVLEPVELRKAIPRVVSYPVAGRDPDDLAHATLHSEKLLETMGGFAQVWSDVTERLDGILDDAPGAVRRAPRTIGEAVEETTAGFLGGLFSGPGGIAFALLSTVLIGVVTWVAFEYLLD